MTAKLLKVETGEVLWSAEILKKSKAKNDKFVKSHLVPLLSC